MNLKRLRAAALDLPWGRRPQCWRCVRWVTLGLFSTLLEAPVEAEGLSSAAGEHGGCFPLWKLSLVTKPRLTAWCLRELSAFAQQCLELQPQALHWVTKCKPLF